MAVKPSKKRDAAAVGDTAAAGAPVEAATAAPAPPVEDAPAASNLPVAIIPDQRVAFAFNGVIITLQAGVTAHVEPAVLALLEQIGTPFTRV